MTNQETNVLPQKPGRKDVAKRVFKHENFLLFAVLLILMAVMSGVTKGLASRPANVSNIILQSSIRGVAAIGQAFVIMTAGIDVSVGGVGLFASILGTTLITQAEHLNPLASPLPWAAGIAVMLLAGAGWGAFSGSLVSRLGMPALIVTLGMWEISKGASFLVCRGRSIGWLPDQMHFFGKGVVAGVPVPIIIFIVVAVIAYFIAQYTTYGRSVYATGGNPISAWLSGIQVKNIHFSVFVISGLLAALAALIMAARAMSSSMTSLVGLEMDSIAAATVGGISLMGGRGSIIGVVIGAIIIGVVNNGMNIMGAGPDVIGIVKGAIIIVAVAVDYLRRRN